MNSIKKELLRVGIPTHLQGYEIIAQGIQLTIKEPTIRMMSLYQILAKDNGITPDRIERNIRYAIAWWQREVDEDIIKEYFGTSASKNVVVTNKQFIRTLALLLDDKEKLNA